MKTLHTLQGTMFKTMQNPSLLATCSIEHADADMYGLNMMSTGSTTS